MSSTLVEENPFAATVPHGFLLDLRAHFPDIVVVWALWPTDGDAVVSPYDGHHWIRQWRGDEIYKMEFGLHRDTEFDYDHPMVVDARGAPCSRTLRGKTRGPLRAARKVGTVYPGKQEKHSLRIPREKLSTGRFVASQLLRGSTRAERLFDICGPWGEYQAPDHRVLAALHVRREATMEQVRAARAEAKKREKAELDASMGPIREALIDHRNWQVGLNQWGYNAPAHPRSR